MDEFSVRQLANEINQRSSDYEIGKLQNIRALALGDDTDTVMAMTGAISGAHLGLPTIPTTLLDRLENETKGRDYIRELSVKLFEKSRPPQTK